MTHHRRQSNEAIYEAFRTVSRPQSIDGCPHCIEMDEIQRFIAAFQRKPLRELTAADLRLYAYKAMTTVGGIDDFEYFLPRILELEFDGSLGVEPEVLGGKLDMAGFDSWSDDRRREIIDGIELAFAECLRSDHYGSDIDSWLCVLGRIHVDLASYLERIRHSGAVLVGYYELNASALQGGLLNSGFWVDAPLARRQVVDWFESDTTKTAIDEQYLKMWTEPLGEN